MSRRAFRAVLALVALAASSAARANTSLTLEAFGGWQHLEIQNPAQQIANAVNGSEGTGIAGGDVLLNLSGLGLGVAVDKTVSGSAQPWAGSIMGGFLLDLLPIRLEALGEIGRRAGSFGDIFASNGATFVGLRPGVSFRLAQLPLRLGVTGLVRWPTSNGSVGSPDYGIVGRVGFEVP
jgi:hypothetical protein